MKTNLTCLLCAVGLALPAAAVYAQPAARAEITPQPEQRIKPVKKRVKPAAAAREARDKREQRLIEEFEALFGRQLTAEQKTQLNKASAERDAAVLAAQEAYTAQFVKITGVSEKELRLQRAKMRKEKAPANGAGAAGAAAMGAGADAPQPLNKPLRKDVKPVRRPVKAGAGNLPDGTPTDAPTITAPEDAAAAP